MKKIKGEVKLNTGRVVEYEGKLGLYLKDRFALGRVKINDKTGLDKPCRCCGQGMIHKHAFGGYAFLGFVIYDSTYGSISTSERKQLFEAFFHQLE